MVATAQRAAAPLPFDSPAFDSPAFDSPAFDSPEMAAAVAAGADRLVEDLRNDRVMLWNSFLFPALRGGIAPQAAILRRTTRTAGRKDIRSGSVRQAFSAGEQNVLSDPPQQVRTGGHRLHPQLKPEKAAVRQAQHALAQIG